jgi:5-(carboxyamino)imidazole ribonucleotide synthase
LGLELGSTKLNYNSIMYNILGNTTFTGEYLPLNVSENGMYLKMYGKKISKPSRKLGHLNIIGINNESIDELLEKLQSIKPKTVIKASE